eukprot:symbB.v1.2.018350.t1/scaffold1457.1/size117646/8
MSRQLDELHWRKGSIPDFKIQTIQFDLWHCDARKKTGSDGCVLSKGMVRTRQLQAQMKERPERPAAVPSPRVRASQLIGLHWLKYTPLSLSTFPFCIKKNGRRRGTGSDLHGEHRT